MEFTSPLTLLALVLLVPLWRLLVRRRAASRIEFTPAECARTSFPRTLLLRFRTPLELLLAGLLIIAFAGPGREFQIETISENGLDVALVLDISASMQAADFPPNRLEALKEIAREFVHRAGGNRISIHAFAKTCFTQSPLTTEHRVLLDLVDGLAYESINHSESGGTAIGDALLGASDMLVDARVEGRDQVVILISDGESNSGVDPLLASRHLREQDLRLHVIGIGDDEAVEVSVHGTPFINTDDEVLTTSLDDEQLRNIADTAGGDYQRARSREVLAAIFDDLSRLERTPLEVQKLAVHKAWRPHLALGLLGLFTALLALRHHLWRPLT